MNHNVYLYILVMAGVTYLIRLLPLTLIKKEIKNVYVKSFLYYVPYVTLSVMTFPAILHATASVWSGAAAWQWLFFWPGRERACSRCPWPHVPWYFCWNCFCK